jgi:hypothetical protein
MEFQQFESRCCQAGNRSLQHHRLVDAQANVYTQFVHDRSQGRQLRLHKFKDGQLYLIRQHACGDWQTVREPKESEVIYFKKYGNAVVNVAPTT